MIDFVLSYLPAQLPVIPWYCWLLVGIILGDLTGPIRSAIYNCLEVIFRALGRLIVLWIVTFVMASVLAGAWLWFTITLQKEKRRTVFNG